MRSIVLPRPGTGEHHILTAVSVVRGSFGVIYLKSIGKTSHAKTYYSKWKADAEAWSTGREGVDRRAEQMIRSGGSEWGSSGTCRQQQTDRCNES